MLSGCDYVIAHSNVMVSKLKDFGCSCELFSLKIFDYGCHLPECKRELSPKETIKISFAGYLAKAEFLTELDKREGQYSLFIYGAPEIPLTNATYMGSRDADELPGVIEGHYGLIWDGHYEAHEKDNYICVNNPHKLSMYIVAGLPVIVWDRSAAARFV